MIPSTYRSLPYCVKAGDEAVREFLEGKGFVEKLRLAFSGETEKVRDEAMQSAYGYVPPDIHGEGCN